MDANSTLVARDANFGVTLFGLMGFVLGIIGYVETFFFIYSAVAGLGDKEAQLLVPPSEGKPWNFWLQPGLDGGYNESDPNWNGPVLQGARGPVPDIHIYNRMGDYLGTPYNLNEFAQENTLKQVAVYPVNVKKYEGQDAQFIILAARSKNPICIADLGLGYADGNGFTNGPWAFSAFTAKSCGAPWYHSGVMREISEGWHGREASPCFWIGGYGLKGMQLHLPSHTQKGSPIPIHKINESIETLHDYFCNTPGILDFWTELPPPLQISKVLITDLKKKAGKTLEDNAKLRRGKEHSGADILARSATSSVSSHHDSTITIAHLDHRGLSAIALCEDAMSMGPDYVNVAEGKFCRMSDKTLWPTCDHVSAGGPRDDCFNVETRQLVVNGRVRRSKPYDREVHYPLDI